MRVYEKSHIRNVLINIFTNKLIAIEQKWLPICPLVENCSILTIYLPKSCFCIAIQRSPRWLQESTEKINVEKVGYAADRKWMGVIRSDKTRTHEMASDHKIIQHPAK